MGLWILILLPRTNSCYTQHGQSTEPLRKQCTDLETCGVDAKA